MNPPDMSGLQAAFEAKEQNYIQERVKYRMATTIGKVFELGCKGIAAKPMEAGMPAMIESPGVQWIPMEDLSQEPVEYGLRPDCFCKPSEGHEHLCHGSMLKLGDLYEPILVQVIKLLPYIHKHNANFLLQWSERLERFKVAMGPVAAHDDEVLQSLEWQSMLDDHLPRDEAVKEALFHAVQTLVGQSPAPSGF